MPCLSVGINDDDPFSRCAPCNQFMNRFRPAGAEAGDDDVILQCLLNTGHAPPVICISDDEMIGCSQEDQPDEDADWRHRSEEHTTELQSLIRNSYAVFCLTKKKIYNIEQQK